MWQKFLKISTSSRELFPKMLPFRNFSCPVCFAHYEKHLLMKRFVLNKSSSFNTTCRRQSALGLVWIWLLSVAKWASAIPFIASFRMKTMFRESKKCSQRNSVLSRKKSFWRDWRHRMWRPLSYWLSGVLRVQSPLQLHCTEASFPKNLKILMYFCCFLLACFSDFYNVYTTMDIHLPMAAKLALHK